MSMDKIGIIGLSGSGKDTVANMLCNRLNIEHISLSSLLRQEHHKYVGGELLSRLELSQYADLLRKQHGPTYLINKALRYSGERVLLSGLYASAEVNRLRNLGGIIIAITASPESRYNRIKLRNTTRDQDLTYAQFIEQSHRELDEHLYIGRASMSQADFIIENDSNQEALSLSVDKILSIFNDNS